MGTTLNSKVKCCCDKEEVVMSNADIDVNIHTQNTSIHDGDSERNLKERNKIKTPTSIEKPKAKIETIQRTVTGTFIKLQQENNLKTEDSKHFTVGLSAKGVLNLGKQLSPNATLSPAVSQPVYNKKSPRNELKPGEYAYPSLSNYTFSNDSNSLVKDNHALRIFMRSKDPDQSLKLSYIPRQSTKPDEIILQSEFMVNNYTINNKLVKTKTKNLTNVSKYVLLTRLSIKICKSRDYYISYGTSLIEVMIPHITSVEYTKNPFSKSTLHTINIIYGKENVQFSISSEDGKEVEIWYKVLQFLLK